MPWGGVQALFTYRPSRKRFAAGTTPVLQRKGCSVNAEEEAAGGR